MASEDYENDKLDATIVVRLSRRLKARVAERARSKQRTLSQWTRSVIDKVLRDLEPTPPTT